MHPIPSKIRAELSKDTKMRICIHNNTDCLGRVEWEHAWIYGGKQIQEVWAIVPVCTYHHRGAGLDKDFNQYCSLKKATQTDLQKYDRFDWEQKKKYLEKKYGK